MNKNKQYNDLIAKLGYFRNRKNLSARELSLLMDRSESYYFRIESGKIKLTCENLFEIMNILEISPTELFYYDPAKYEEDKEILELLKKMTKEEKEALCQIIKMKK